MTVLVNFEPYYDFESVSDEMAEDLFKSLQEYEKQKNLMLASLPENRAEIAQALLKAQQEINSVSNAVFDTIYTVPAMIHEAGPKVTEYIDGNEIHTQRCARCGSILQRWDPRVTQNMSFSDEDGNELDFEEAIPWWNEGDLVGKATGDFMAQLYLVEDRELDSHEKPCLDMSGLFEGLDGELSEEN